MQNRKTTLITIIVLLLLFIPFAIISTVLHFQNNIDTSTYNQSKNSR